MKNKILKALKSNAFFNFFVFFFYFIVAIIFTYPLFFELHNLTQPGDVALNMTLLQWNYNIIDNKDFLNYLKFPFFYPYNDALLYSESFIFLGIISYPIYKITGSTIYSFNLMFFMSFVFSAYTAYLLASYYTKNKYVSILAGLLFGFSAPRFGNFGQIQIVSSYFLPLLILFFEKWITKMNLKNTIYFSAILVILAYISLYQFVFGTIVIGLVFVFRLLIYKIKPDWKVTFKFLFLSGAIILLLVGPLYYKYYEFSKDNNTVRSINENRYYSADITSIITTTDSNLLYPNTCQYTSMARKLFTDTPMPCYESYLFPGFLVLLFVALSIFVIRKYKSAYLIGLNANKDILYPLSITFSLFILSLGPTLKVLGLYTPIPLPYYLLYYLYIPLQGTRVPGRLSHLFMLFIGITFAICVLIFINKFKNKFIKAAMIGVFAFIILLESYSTPPFDRNNYDYKNPAFEFVKSDNSIEKIIFLPIGKTEPEKIRNNTNYMFTYSTHGKTTVNGYSGFFPDGHKELTKFIDENFPNQLSIDLLRLLDIDAVIIDKSDAQNYQAITSADSKIVFSNNLYDIYKIESADIMKSEKIEITSMVTNVNGRNIEANIILKNDSEYFWLYGQSTPSNRKFEFYSGGKLICSYSIKLPLFLKPNEEKIIPINCNVPKTSFLVSTNDIKKEKIEIKILSK